MMPQRDGLDSSGGRSAHNPPAVNRRLAENETNISAQAGHRRDSGNRHIAIRRRMATICLRGTATSFQPDDLLTEPTVKTKCT